MRNIWIIVKRETVSYFATPLAYVFIVIFLALSGALAFFIGRFMSREQADLIPFFDYHPWLYLLLIPAIAMRLWAEERKTGTIENLMTLPVSTGEAVIGKFLAAWGFAGLALSLTFTMWISVTVLGCSDAALERRHIVRNRLIHIIFIFMIGCPRLSLVKCSLELQ